MFVLLLTAVVAPKGPSALAPAAFRLWWKRARSLLTKSWFTVETQSSYFKVRQLFTFIRRKNRQIALIGSSSAVPSYFNDLNNLARLNVPDIVSSWMLRSPGLVCIWMGNDGCDGPQPDSRKSFRPQRLNKLKAPCVSITSG